MPRITTPGSAVSRIFKEVGRYMGTNYFFELAFIKMTAAQNRQTHCCIKSNKFLLNNLE